MISIITPIYNTPSMCLQRYLNALKSIDKTQFEVILINDGGETPQINFSDWDFDIKYIEYEKNRGPGYARQIGINNATYDYIMFCDSDDSIKKQGFIFCLDEIKNGFPDILYPSLMGVISENTNQIVDNIFPGNIHGLCIKKSFLIDNEITFLNEYFHEDNFFALECCEVLRNVNGSITQIGVPIVVHYMRPNSISYFQNSDIYNLSLAASVATLYEKIPYMYYVYDTDEESVWSNEIKARLLGVAKEVCDHGAKDENFIFLLNFIYSCLWPTLPSCIQNDIKSYLQDHFALLNVKEVVSDIKNIILEICCQDDGAIKNYLLKQCYSIYNIYYTLYEKYPFEPITILIPTYNNSKEQITKAMKSIQEQKLSNFFKIIIVDDGSDIPVTPDSFDNILANQTTIIRHQQNKGVGQARQTALNAIDTPIGLFMDMDDFLLNPYFTIHALAILSKEPDLFGIKGQEYVESCDEWVFGDFYYGGIGNMHGFIFHVSPLEKYNIKFLPFQYGEDGIFVSIANFYELPVLSLEEHQYHRGKGYLTHNIYNVVGNFNTLTDFVLTARVIANLKNFDQPEEIFEKKKTFILTNIISEALSTIKLTGTLEENDEKTIQLVRHTSISEDIRYLWNLYFTIELFKSIPLKYLIQLRQTPDIHQYHQVIPVLDNILMEIDSYWYFPENSFLSFEEILYKCQSWLKENLEIEGQNPDNIIIPQALKHLPWCYTPTTKK